MLMLRFRYFQIVFFFLRVILNLLFWDLFLSAIGFRRIARRTRPKRLKRFAVKFRSLAVRMGGVLIKVGQFLSARVDVLPIEIIQELASLQDEVPAVDYESIRSLAEAELGAPLSELFAHFETTPLAAASLGQVHRAKLFPQDAIQIPMDAADPSQPAKSITDIVVKIQRPDIEAVVAIDLAALKTVGNLIKRYRPISRRADIPALIAEFSRTLYEEIDYIAEGNNAVRFAENFKDRPDVRVPSVDWVHTTKRVLALEDVYAIKITDYEHITNAGIDRGQVAKRLFDTYLQQIFEDGFFHADPHPGNLFVSPLLEAAEGESKWQLTFVDFGMAGHIPANMRAGLRELAIATATQDAARQVRSYQLLGVLLPSADLKLIERMEGMIFERIWGKSMAELQEISFEEMHDIAIEFREIIYSMPFQIPQDMIYLGRTIAILSGMCTGLHPEFNFWESITPFAQDLLAEEAGSNWQYWLSEAGSILQTLIGLPKRFDRVMGQMERGEFAVRIPEIKLHLRRIERSGRQMTGAIIFFALLVSGVQLHLADEFVFSWILMGSAFLNLLWVMLPRRRRH